MASFGTTLPVFRTIFLLTSSYVNQSANPVTLIPSLAKATLSFASILISVNPSPFVTVGLSALVIVNVGFVVSPFTSTSIVFVTPSLVTAVSYTHLTLPTTERV